ncbi:hypothetical protein ZYGR_0AK00370 [Zygosaccharomyces rouxii]|uniref:THIF-type NAD/FAD binding fold domain-containing protein n=1 Tax=Zygosaccharomyces rouxii TaxID=4956 RepID=A0A1Q3AD45_ZYGRO|nr:hypothetical protein ZYGR_0AK00370 [Zygosaccharomyces rouxii]
MESSQVTTERLSKDEIDLYDRQIRLWGMAAQARMRSAKVLLIGLGSLGTEICKNVVLCGLGHLTILDDSVVQEEDLGSQFFISSEDVGSLKLDSAKARIQDLNPRVHLSFDTQSIESKAEDFYKGFDLVIGTELSTSQMVKLNELTRKYNIPVYLAGSNGLFAYIFVDLIQFDAEDEKLKGSQPTEKGKISKNTEVIEVRTRHDEDDDKKVFEVIKTRHYYKSFQQMIKTASLEGRLNRRQIKRLSSAVPLTFTLLQTEHEIGHLNFQTLKEKAIETCRQLGVPGTVLNDTYVEQFTQQEGVQFAPVSAVIGGSIAQDVINILGKRQPPLNNFIVFDGITLDMPIFEF